jgi:hypothetical protein
MAAVAAIAAPTKSVVYFIVLPSKILPSRKRRSPGMPRLRNEFSQESSTGAI